MPCHFRIKVFLIRTNTPTLSANAMFFANEYYTDLFPRCLLRRRPLGRHHPLHPLPRLPLRRLKRGQGGRGRRTD
jgi:hypothetical protein